METTIPMPLTKAEHREAVSIFFLVYIMIQFSLLLKKTPCQKSGKTGMRRAACQLSIEVYHGGVLLSIGIWKRGRGVMVKIGKSVWEIMTEVFAFSGKCAKLKAN